MLDRLAKFEPGLTNGGRFRPMCGRLRQNLHRCRPNLGKSRKMWAGIRAKCGPMPTKHRVTSDKLGPSFH